MYSFKNTTPTNGFDFNNLNNARQNNYAWSMEELDQYIYVGTGRNVPYNIFKNISPEIITPISITPPSANNAPEIWRYKKNDSLPWEKVYSVPKYLQISGLRFIVSHKPFNGNKNLYAASYGGKLKITYIVVKILNFIHGKMKLIQLIHYMIILKIQMAL